MSKNQKTVIALLCLTVILIIAPVAALRGADFGGSDDAGSAMVEEIAGSYEPWALPVMECMLGGALPGELESLLFCIQTGIGVGIIAFCLGRMTERKKWTQSDTGENGKEKKMDGMP